MSGLYDRLNPDPGTFFDRNNPEAERIPLEVPATAVYSRADGIVRWHACIEADGPLRENIEVRGSHSGLGYNPAVLIAISDRLAQREGSWRPFRPPPGTSPLFPQPATWDAARGRGPARRWRPRPLSARRSQDRRAPRAWFLTIDWRSAAALVQMSGWASAPNAVAWDRAVADDFLALAGTIRVGAAKRSSVGRGHPANEV